MAASHHARGELFLTNIVLGALFVLWPLIALAGGMGFSVFTGLAALLLLPVIARSLRPRLYTFALLAFFIYAGASSMWSPREQVMVSIDFGKMQFAIRSEMLRVGLQIAALGGLIAAALRLDDSAKARLQGIAHVALLVQLAMLVVLTIFEKQVLELLRPLVPDTGEGVQNLSRNCIIMGVAAPVLAIGLARQKPPPLAIAIIAGVIGVISVILFVREVHAGLLAIALAGGCVALVHVLPKHGFKILGLLIASLLMSAPWLYGFLSKGADFATANDSASYRAAIWQRVIELINQHPLEGNGLGALRTVRETIETGVFKGELTVPNHAHNMMLQLWAETGAIGAGLLSLAIILVGWRLGDARKLGAAGFRAAAIAGAMVAIAGVSFDVWNDWWWAVGGLLAVLAVATPRSVSPGLAPQTGGQNAAG